MIWGFEASSIRLMFNKSAIRILQSAIDLLLFKAVYKAMKAHTGIGNRIWY